MSITTITKDICLCNSQQKQEHLKSVVEDISNNKAILMRVFSKGAVTKHANWQKHTTILLANSYLSSRSASIAHLVFYATSTTAMR
jgi:hypothetical protein